MGRGLWHKECNDILHPGLEFSQSDETSVRGYDIVVNVWTVWQCLFAVIYMLPLLHAEVPLQPI